jgi:uncharacterized protein YbjT (DUF2867 family)
MGNGKNLMQPIAVEDVAHCFVRALTMKSRDPGESRADAGLHPDSLHPEPPRGEREQPVAVVPPNPTPEVASARNPILALPSGEGRGEGNGGAARTNVASAIQGTFDLCGDERFTFLEIVDAILAATHRRRLKLKIPLPIARVQAAFLEFICPNLLRKAPPLNRDQLRMLQEDNIGDPEPAKRLFGFTPVKFREGIRAYLNPDRSR